MPTTNTRTVKSAGGDYTSLSAWEAGRQGNLVTSDTIERAELYAFEDTTAVMFDGWTTDATRYILLEQAASARHDGKWSTAAYRLNVTGASAHTINNFEEYLRADFLQLCATNTSGDGNVFRNACGATSDVRLSNVILRGVRTGGNLYGFHNAFTGPTARLRNLIIYDLDSSASLGVYNAAGTIYCYNTTAVNCGYGFWRDAGTVVVKNCIAQDCINEGFNGTFDAASTNNCSDVASDAPGSNPRTGEVSFVDEANDDFHLASGDTVAKDFGADLSADANFAFSDDIDGATRSGTWDIGADEVTSGGTAHTLSVSDSLSFSDTPAKQTSVPKTDSVTIADAKTITTGKVLSDSFSVADSQSSSIVIVRSLSDSLSFADSKVFEVGKVVTETLSISDTATPLLISGSPPGLSKSVSDSLAFSDSVTNELTEGPDELDDPVQIRWGKYLHDHRRIARENVRFKRLQKLARIRL